MITNSALETPCGTPNYVAPEVLLHHGYEGRIADLWSCGVVLYVMLAGMLPFDEQSDALLFDKIKRGEHRGYPTWFSSGVKHLLDRILVPDPARRVTIAEIKKDPWFTVNYQPIEGKAFTKPTAADLQEVSGSQDVEEGVQESVPKPSGVQAVGMDAFSLISMLDTLNINRMLEHRGADDVKRRTCFVLSANSNSTFDILTKVMHELRVDAQPAKAQLKLRCTSGQTTFSVQVHGLTTASAVVEINRRKGDVFHFHKLYNNVMERSVAVAKRNVGSA